MSRTRVRYPANDNLLKPAQRGVAVRTGGPVAGRGGVWRGPRYALASRRGPVCSVPARRKTQVMHAYVALTVAPGAICCVTQGDPPRPDLLAQAGLVLRTARTCSGRTAARFRGCAGRSRATRG